MAAGDEAFGVAGADGGGTGVDWGAWTGAATAVGEAIEADWSAVVTFPSVKPALLIASATDPSGRPRKLGIT